jgi:DNA-binding CsgD family transcriptional regulator/tetratricopeptide (TPR) repeat protein
MLLGRLAQAYRHLGRGETGRETLRRALAMLPDDRPTPERVWLLVEQVASLMLQGRYRECTEAAEEGLRIAAEAGDEVARGNVLNRLGVALFATCRDEEGSARLREGIAIAERMGDLVGRSTGYLNLADSLHLGGHTREALEVVREGGEGVAPEERVALWIALSEAHLSFDAGDWKRAEALVPRSPARSGNTRVNDRMRRTELALGRGRHEEARLLLDELTRLLRDSLEPQYIGPAGTLRAELERRSGDLDAARGALEDALDRIEFCSEDARRVAEVAAMAVCVEADIAQRARDLGDAEAERDAISRAEIQLMRAEAAASESGPVEQALLACAEADAERARRLGGDPDLWAATAQAWTELERPYPAAIARWREAEAHLAAGDREAATQAAATAHVAAQQLDPEAWLACELEGLAARGRLRLTGEPAADEPAADEDPFGLTARERQVLALLADGATNREIGAQLYMAEKTASVHVSRILAKLGVRSRTEAAALAHRHALV